MADRHFDRNGSRAHTAEAFAFDIREAHRFKWPLERVLHVARFTWSLDDYNFGWEATRLMRETPRGYCSTCGVGWSGFLDCTGRERCNYVDDNLGNPSPHFPPETRPDRDALAARSPARPSPAAPVTFTDLWGS